MKSELNFPIGQKEPLDFGEASDGKRWEVASHIIGGFGAAIAQVPPAHLRENKRCVDILIVVYDAIKKGIDENKLQRQPHIVLLDTSYYRAELRPAFAEWVLLYLQAEQVNSSTGAAKAQLLAYLPP